MSDAEIVEDDEEHGSMVDWLSIILWKKLYYYKDYLGLRNYNYCCLMVRSLYINYISSGLSSIDPSFGSLFWTIVEIMVTALSSFNDDSHDKAEKNDEGDCKLSQLSSKLTWCFVDKSSLEFFISNDGFVVVTIVFWHSILTWLSMLWDEWCDSKIFSLEVFSLQ